VTRLPRISDLAGDTEGWGFFLCTYKELRPIRSGELLLFTLQDATGQISAKLFDDIERFKDEFEAGETPEAQFANAIDRLQPVIANHITQGKSWTSHHVRASQVEARCQPITTGAPTLGAYARNLIEDALQRGFLMPD